MAELRLDESGGGNAGVIRFVRGILTGQAPITRPDAVADPYYEQGSHPDVVERVWDQLGASLPTDCRSLVYGAPALVHPTAGVVLAFSMGTGYYVRLPGALEESPAAFGTEFERRRDVEAARELGADWVPGRWSADEVAWCRATFDELERHAG